MPPPSPCHDGEQRLWTTETTCLFIITDCATAAAIGAKTPQIGSAAPVSLVSKRRCARLSAVGILPFLGCNAAIIISDRFFSLFISLLLKSEWCRKRKANLVRAPGKPPPDNKTEPKQEGKNGGTRPGGGDRLRDNHFRRTLPV